MYKFVLYIYTCSPALIPDCCEDAIIKSSIPSFYVLGSLANSVPRELILPTPDHDHDKTQKNKRIKALRAENSGKKETDCSRKEELYSFDAQENHCLQKCLRQRPYYGSCANSCSCRSCSSRAFSAAIRLFSTSWIIWLCSFSE